MGKRINISKDIEAISKRFKEKVFHMDMSFKETAQRANISYSTVSNLCKGKSKYITEDSLNRLSTILFTTTEYLLTGKDTSAGASSGKNFWELKTGIIYRSMTSYYTILDGDLKIYDKVDHSWNACAFTYKNIMNMHFYPLMKFRNLTKEIEPDTEILIRNPKRAFVYFYKFDTFHGQELVWYYEKGPVKTMQACSYIDIEKVMSKT